MKLQSFAESRKITPAKVKKLVKELFTEFASATETELAKLILSDEQMAKIDLTLAVSGNGQLPPAQQNPEVSALSNFAKKEEIQRTTQILGVTTLKKNAELYVKIVHQTAFEISRYTHRVMEALQMEQANLLAQSMNNMARNVIAVRQEFANTLPIDLSVPVQFTQEDEEWLEAQLILESM